MEYNEFDFDGYACSIPHQTKEKILLGHGSGGKLSHDLINNFFLPELKNAAPRNKDDAAIISLNGRRLALTTDSYVVSPLFFPGGDIGKLAVCGTVNDLSMVGATPIALTCGYIIEEGLPLEILKRVVHSIQETALEAKIYIAAGDTKVVQRGGVDKLFINTTGLGYISEGINISGSNAIPGDVIIISGTIGDHGIAILSVREGLGFETDLQSDVAPLNHLVKDMTSAGEIKVLRDPTRGGLGTSLVEITQQSNVTIEIYERDIPIMPQVRAACEMLGFDPLYIANEGKLVAFVAERDADKVLSIMRKHQYGQSAAIIGRVIEAGKPRIYLKTIIGGKRIVDMLPGELLPRIC